VFEGSAPPGFIRVADLVRELKTYCSEKLTEQQISELMAQLEVDPDGLVNYVEYVNLMMT
jgi:Ca2+-binding EF-hand superfamily protein